MGAFYPRAENLPAEFPVFPLTGALLLPRGRLPLNIFEPRYLALVEDSLGAGRLFGMVQPNPLAPPSPVGPGLFRVGCLGRISSFSETEDGRYLITLTGVVRFEIDHQLPLERGYRRVRGRYDEFTADLDSSPPPIGLEREALLDAVRGYFVRCGLEANWDAINRMADDVLVTTLCMACPFEPAEKQALLEAPTDEDRGHALLGLLQMGGIGATHCGVGPVTN